MGCTDPPVMAQICNLQSENISCETTPGSWGKEKGGVRRGGRGKEGREGGSDPRERGGGRVVEEWWKRKVKRTIVIREGN